MIHHQEQREFTNKCTDIGAAIGFIISILVVAGTIGDFEIEYENNLKNVFTKLIAVATITTVFGHAFKLGSKTIYRASNLINSCRRANNTTESIQLFEQNVQVSDEDDNNHISNERPGETNNMNIV